MNSTCYVFIELWGLVSGEPGRDFLYDGNPIFFLDNLTEKQAYAAGDAVTNAKKVCNVSLCSRKVSAVRRN